MLDFEVHGGVTYILMHIFSPYKNIGKKYIGLNFNFNL